MIKSTVKSTGGKFRVGVLKVDGVKKNRQSREPSHVCSYR